MGLIGLLLAIALLSYVLIQINGSRGAKVLVTIDGNEYGEYDLSEDQEIPIVIDGVETNRLEIKDGKANMVWADCPDQLCVHQKAISKEKESIICLPNRIVVTVISEDESDFDVMLR